MTVCCRDRGGGVVVARAAVGFVVLPMEHRDGKNGGRGPREREEIKRNQQRGEVKKQDGGWEREGRMKENKIFMES